MFYCHGKYFAKENFGTPAWTPAKCFCGNKTGNPERAVLLHPARSGSQSQRGNWFILPARGACHIINIRTYSDLTREREPGFKVVRIKGLKRFSHARNYPLFFFCLRGVKLSESLSLKEMSQNRDTVLSSFFFGANSQKI